MTLKTFLGNSGIEKCTPDTDSFVDYPPDKIFETFMVITIEDNQDKIGGVKRSIADSLIEQQLARQPKPSSSNSFTKK